MKHCLLLLALAVSALAADTQNWPQYRGANSDGLGEGATLPETWSETENVVWKVKVPGWGWSSPIVWGDKVFVTAAVGEKELPTPHVGGYVGTGEVHLWMLYCLDFETGKILWEFEAHKGIPPQMRLPRSSFANETPVTDGERVYAYFANIGLFSVTCLATKSGSSAGRATRCAMAGTRAPRPCCMADASSFRMTTIRSPGSKHRQDALACGTRGAQHLVHAVCVGKRPAHRIGNDRHEQNSLLCAGAWRVTVGDKQHRWSREPDSTFEARTALCGRRLPLRAALRDQTRRKGRHHAARRCNEQRVHRVVAEARLQHPSRLPYQR